MASNDWVDVGEWLNSSGSKEPVALQADGDAGSLPLKSRRIEAVVDADLGICETVETLTYAASKDCSATFKFPLPPKAALYKFEAKIGERVIRTATKKVEAARTEFQEATRQGHSAVLVEKKSADIFSVQLGNLPAGQSCEIRVGYLALVDKVDGCLEYLHTATWVPPYQSARDDAQEVQDATPAFTPQVEYAVRYRLEVRSAAGVKAVTEARDNITVAFSPTGCIVEQAAQVSDPSRDWQVMVELNPPPPANTDKGGSGTAAAGAAGTSLVLQECRRGEGNQVKAVVKAVFTPPADTVDSEGKEGSGPRKEMWLVVDCSGSMSGAPMAQAREAALFFVKDLPVSAGVLFNIVAFGSSHRFLYAGGCRPYDSTTQAEAVQWIQSGLWADMGGTEILDTMKAIYDQPITQGYDREIIFLTDGGISGSEERDVWRLVEKGAARRQAPEGPIHTAKSGLGKVFGFFKPGARRHEPHPAGTEEAQKGTEGGQAAAEEEEQAVVANSPAAAATAGACRVFCLGIGHGVHRGLLDGMAERSNALAAFVTDDENIAVKAGMLKRCAMGRGLLRAPKLLGRGCMVKTVPAVLPPVLFPGQPITILAELVKAEPTAALKLTATRVDGGEWSQELRLGDATKVEGDMLAVLHAMGYISELLRGASQLHVGQDGKPRPGGAASPAQVEEEVVRVAVAENLVTPHTATVGVLCHQDPLDPDKVEHVDIPIQLPAGRTLWGTDTSNGGELDSLFGMVPKACMALPARRMCMTPPGAMTLRYSAAPPPPAPEALSECASLGAMPRARCSSGGGGPLFFKKKLVAPKPAPQYFDACDWPLSKSAAAAPASRAAPTYCAAAPAVSMSPALTKDRMDADECCALSLGADSPKVALEAAAVQRSESESEVDEVMAEAGEAPVPGKGGAAAAAAARGGQLPPLSPKDALHELNLRRTVEGFWHGEQGLMELLARAVAGVAGAQQGGAGGAAGVTAKGLQGGKPAALGDDAWATVLVLAFLRKHLGGERSLWEAMATKAQGWLQAGWPAGADRAVGATILAAMKQL